MLYARSSSFSSSSYIPWLCRGIVLFLVESWRIDWVCPIVDYLVYVDSVEIFIFYTSKSLSLLHLSYKNFRWCGASLSYYIFAVHRCRVSLTRFEKISGRKSRKKGDQRESSFQIAHSSVLFPRVMPRKPGALISLYIPVARILSLRRRLWFTGMFSLFFADFSGRP